MRTIVALGLTVALASGCHAKFKKNVGSLDAVQLDILLQSGPSVSLGGAVVVADPTPESDAEAIAGGVAAAAAGIFNVTQAVKANKLNNRIASAVDLERTSSVMLESVAQTLGNAPFSVAGEGVTQDLLQIEVLDWGLEVPALGAQGSFNYNVRARIYKGNGDRIYSSRLSCEVAAGSPGAGSQALGLVNNVKQLEQMSDDELQEAFEGMADYCGGIFVAKMRKHAG